MQPTQADNPVRPLLFFRESSPGADSMILDARVICQSVREGVRGQGSADLLLRWEPHVVGGETIEAELLDATIASRLGAVVRCAVAIGPPPGGDNLDLVFLANGYCDLRELKVAADRNQTLFSRKLVLRDIINRTGRREGSHVYGRWMLSEAGWEHARDNPEEDPIDLPWSTLAKHVQSLPCIFNPGGRPNRLARPVVLDAENVWSSGPVHIFTYEGDPAAEYWTLLQALRYLVLLHLPYGLSEQVGPGDLFTEALGGPGGGPWWRQDETDVALAGDYPVGWQEHMTRRSQSLALEGMDFVEALAALTSAANVEFNVAHSNESTVGEVRVLSNLRFVAPGDLARDHLAFERSGSHFTTSGSLRSIEDIIAQNNTQQCRSALEFGNAASRVRVLGDRVWRTVTAELKPLWQPDPAWDIEPPLDPEEVAPDLVDEAMEDENTFASRRDGAFYARFCAGGGQFAEGENSIIGRLWGLDTAGEYDDATYGRTNFDTYGQPWPIPGASDQVPRRREIRRVPTQDGARALDIVIEVNFGETDPEVWYRLQSRIQVLPGQAAMYITSPDLLGFAGEVLGRPTEVDGPTIGEELEVLNWYEAYLLGKFKLRATFQIELDHRLEQVVNAADSPVAAHTVAAIVSRERDFQAWFQDAGVPSDFLASMQTRNDYDAAERFARATLAERAYADWSGRAVIPWIEIDRYRLGTPIEGIRRQAGGAVEILFGGSTDRQNGLPRVVERIWVQKDDGRSGEVSTTLVLHDHRFARAMGSRNGDRR